MACARTTSTIVYLLTRKGHFALCYLDDFIRVAATKKEAEAANLDMLATADDLGLALAPAKCTPPTKALDWLRYTICA